MSYLICMKCGKEYPLPEGKESFDYQNCECGGKLEYSPLPKRNYVITQQDFPSTKEDPPVTQQGPENKQYTKSSPLPSLIKWKGVFVGISFLFTSMLLSVAIIFGKNLPASPSDIPIELLTYLGILLIVLTIIAGFIPAYLSGSKKFLEGALNGGMVGLILGFTLGLMGGTMVFVSGTIILGSISMIGGVIGIFPRKLFK